MSLGTPDLTQTAPKMALRTADSVPKLDAVGIPEAAAVNGLGFWPMAALAVAVAATVIWNAFLLWEGSKLVLGWLGLT